MDPTWFSTQGTRHRFDRIAASHTVAIEVGQTRVHDDVHISPSERTDHKLLSTVVAVPGKPEPKARGGPALAKALLADPDRVAGFQADLDAAAPALWGSDVAGSTDDMLH